MRAPLVVAALAAVLGTGCFGTSGIQTGVVVISTTPSGARAFVNGNEVCSATPCNWTEGNGLAYRYHLQIRKEGYKDVDFYLDKDLRFFDALFTVWSFRMPTQVPLKLEPIGAAAVAAPVAPAAPGSPAAPAPAATPPPTTAAPAPL